MKNQMKQQLPAIKEWIENIRLPSNGKAAGPSQISIKRDKEYAEELYSQNTMKDYYYDIDKWMIKINNFCKSYLSIIELFLITRRVMTLL
ncbi:uncharacterized protein OCT59_001570 [Rhizophagus irregularis]|uniref:uncharacterized protein n=1 Tax=Rhizophagus irregularis TaxID=588596 RepID=UPI0019EF8405|nr:hypothetical protein OCT59_001570 [Rhizophagus irregularis]GBC50431.2 hypothetical protein RIR_jg11475.t1 [Rhizophagus irregularis DAOM 181602=DAOM 197198]